MPFFKEMKGLAMHKKCMLLNCAIFFFFFKSNPLVFGDSDSDISLWIGDN